MQEEFRGCNNDCGCNNNCACNNNCGFLGNLFGRNGCCGCGDSEILFFIIVFLLLFTGFGRGNNCGCC